MEKVVFMNDYGIALRALTHRLQNFIDIHEYVPEEYTDKVKKEHEELVNIVAWLCEHDMFTES